MRIICPILALVAFVLGPSRTTADELLPRHLPLEQAIDAYIDAQIQEAGAQAAGQVGDAQFIRRLTLDLAGRIPTLEETRTFVASTKPDKRVELVERLMNSPAFVRHQATEFDTMLMNGTRGSVRPYLLAALTEGRSWDRIYRDLMLPDENDPKLKPAVEFLRQRVRDLDKLTAEVSAIFFGVNVSCARCHDHPLVADWKQDHFFGMKSFFSRTYESGGWLAERETGLVKFKTTKGVEREARLMFLTGKVVQTDTLKETPGGNAKKGKRNLAKSGPPPAPPKFSARGELVELSLQPGQRDFFARSIVNRLWHRFFGYGLVMPLDQMHSENAPNHPELLDWLARDLVEHQYDLRRLIRGLVLSRAYARDSLCDKGDVPQPSLFAVARVKPLTPMQLAVSLRLAVTDPQALPAASKPEELDKRLQGLESSAGGLARLFEQPSDDFQVGVSEALLFSNGAAIEKDLLAGGGDRLLNRLKQLKNEEAIDVAVQTILCRPPRDAERKLLGDYLKQRADRPAEARRQMVWALLTSAEFRFNY
jgi:hypothetical protein